MTAPGRLIRLLAAATLAVVIAVLVVNMPEPSLPPHIESPGGIERTLTFLAWLGLLVLAVGLVLRLARARQRTATAAPMRNLRPTPRRRPARALHGGYRSHAFPLTLQERTVDRTAPTPEEGQQTLITAQKASRKPLISLLGPPTIEGLQKRDRRLRGTTRELLYYLALHPGGAHREQIIDALWPDHAPEQARNRLWRAAADARAQLGETALNRDGDRYRLDRGEVEIDLERLEVLLGRLASGMDEELPVLEQSLALFHGEPLAGVDMPWAESEQRRLQAVRLDLLERSARALVGAGDAASALSRAEEGLCVEPYNEKLARLAMRAEAALGLRGAVIDRYRRLRETLQEQLGLEPHAETKRLYRQLLGQDEPEPAGRS